jgi:dipeptidyl aminopeptidase/acylaminoacyl peptidase
MTITKTTARQRAAAIHARRMATCAVLLLAVGSQRAPAQPRPTIPAAEYGRFEALVAPVLAPRGDWLAYGISRVDETRELRLRPVDRDTTIVAPWGEAPRFSPNGRHVAWGVGLPTEERRRLEQERKPIRLKATVRELASGSERTFDDVRELRFDATGRFLALHGYAPEEPKGKGADLRLLDLASGTITTFGNVAEFAWSDVAAQLAMALATGSTTGNGVHVYDAATQRLSALDASGSSYRRLAWRRDALDLAVLRSVRDIDEDSAAHVLIIWGDVARSARREELDIAATPYAATHVLTRHSAPRWADDGARIAIGLRPAPTAAERAMPAPADTAARDSAGADTAPADSAGRNDGELPKLQIWHTSDVRMVAQQKVQAAADARRTLLAAWTPRDGRVVVVGTDPEENASIPGRSNWRFGVEKLASPYPWGAMFGRRFHDVWLVDLDSGERTRALERVRFSWESPGGRWLLHFDGEHYWTYDVRTGRRTNITANVPAVFADTAYDTPTDVLPPHGMALWLANDAAVLLNDRYDVWRITPDGRQAERLTRGAGERVVHRLVRLDTRESFIDPRAPMYFSLYGERTKQRGYARLRPGRAIERLLLEERHVSALARADSADVLLFRREARDSPPELFMAGPALADARSIVRTNPFAGEYAWGRAELIDYTSEAGIPLQGTLLYPANHDPSRRYPMIVYAYELMTPQMHMFQVPSERSYYNFTAWTQHGYFVLLPDIVYRAREPGVSALEAVHPAVSTVVERGLADERRVGFIGHSWGGYQATYVATHSDRFAASVAGAPLTDFVSFMGQIHWNAGNAEVDHWETGQARMEVPYWEDADAHHRNSPLHRVHEMNTPLLMAHGDRDGVVEFFQATVFYNFARRAGRPMVLLVYEDENHSFQQKANQIDYHRRILEWFGHYLKGEPAPQWIRDGVRWDAHDEEKRRVAGE